LVGRDANVNYILWLIGLIVVVGWLADALVGTGGGPYVSYGGGGLTLLLVLLALFYIIPRAGRVD
jgi:hypothetical protein